VCSVLRRDRRDNAAGLLHRKRSSDTLSIRVNERHDRVAGDEVHLLLQGGAQLLEHTLDRLDDLDDRSADVEAKTLTLKG